MCEYSDYEEKLSKRLRKVRKKDKMKNEPKRGKSMRHGNAPSPYTKYNKVPYKYMTVASNQNTRRDGPTKTVEQQIRLRKYAA